MKLSRSNVIIAAMAVVIAVLTWALVFYARDELKLTAGQRDDDKPARSAVTVDDGFAVVGVSAESQKASGIVTAQLEAARSEVTTEVYGVVLNPQSLLDLRGRYLVAAAEVRGLNAVSVNSRAEFERLKKLFDDDRNISERALLSAESQWQGHQARLVAAEQSAAMLLDELRLGWGPLLARWAGEANSAALDALATQRAFLILMTLPHELQNVAAHAALTVAPVSMRTSQRPVRFVSASPQTDTTLSGMTYLYLAEDPGLRSGMRLVGQVRVGGSKSREGVIVPPTAVVWHGGKAWVYVKEDAGRFVRRPLATSQEMGKGWFAGEGFESGDHVVVSGAQLLLSEELKFQIRNENED
jgi:hypothetical protein